MRGQREKSEVDTSLKPKPDKALRHFELFCDCSVVRNLCEPYHFELSPVIKSKMKVYLKIHFLSSSLSHPVYQAIPDLSGQLTHLLTSCWQLKSDLLRAAANLDHFSSSSRTFHSGFPDVNPSAQTASSAIHKIVQAYRCLMSVSTSNLYRCFSVHVYGILKLVTYLGKYTSRFIHGVLLHFGTSTAPAAKIKITNIRSPFVTVRA
jgi:hypothetical protein